MVIDKLLKQIYFLLHKKVYNIENLAHLYIRYIFTKHKMLKEIILNRESTFAFKF
jgi:hypothetical protein